MEGQNLKLKAYISDLCRKLIEFDPDIVEIVQFGSSVYAPKYANDVDLFIMTKRKKGYSGYFDLANPFNAPINVDVVVHEVGERMMGDFIRNVLGAFERLYGSGDYIKSLAKSLDDPTFEQARSYIRGALEDFELAKRTVNPLDKDRRIREAFDALFHAARIASMVYLSTETTRWGMMKRMLPTPYMEEFDQMIKNLHVDYFYHGSYPKDDLEQEFNSWSIRIKNYVDRLEAEVKSRESKGK